MEQQVTFNWRYFSEETPDEGKPIMVKHDYHPLYWAHRDELVGRHFFMGDYPLYLSQAKRKKSLVWCYCAEIDAQTKPDMERIYGTRRRHR